MMPPYEGEERRQHHCIQEENIGKFKEFMGSMKGLRLTLSTIAIAIILQVGTFLFLWGGLTATVNMHDKTIDKILTKLDSINVIGYVQIKGDKGDMGIQGIQGIQGKSE